VLTLLWACAQTLFFRALPTIDRIICHPNVTCSATIISYSFDCPCVCLYVTSQALPIWDLGLFGSDTKVDVSGNGRVARCVLVHCALQWFLNNIASCDFSPPTKTGAVLCSRIIIDAEEGAATVGTTAKFDTPGVHHFAVMIRSVDFPAVNRFFLCTCLCMADCTA